MATVAGMPGRLVQVFRITMRERRVLLRVVNLVGIAVLILSVAASFLQDSLALDATIVILRWSIGRQHPQAQVSLLYIHHPHECRKRECRFGMLGLSSKAQRSFGLAW